VRPPATPPPRLALWLIDRLLSPAAAEAISGDLLEEFQRQARTRGAAFARRWFWRQTVASIASRGRRGSRRQSAHETRYAMGHGAGRTSGWTQDLRFAVRVLAKSPGFTTTAVLTLAVGVAGATTIATAAGWVWLRGLPYAAADQLVLVGESNRDDDDVGTVGYETVLDWQAGLNSLDAVVPIRAWTPTLATDRGAERLNGLRVGWQYFGMLGVRPALGRDFTEEDDHPERWRVLLISHRLWQQRFDGRLDVVGRAVSFSGRDYQVVGVLPADFEPLISEHFYARADVWAPLGYAVSDPSACRTCRHLRAIGRLAPTTTVPAATAELAVLHAGLRAGHGDDYGETPPKIARLETRFSGQFERPFQVLMGAVAFLLFIACANVAGLLITRSADREREIAVRAALGAGRLRLVRQLLTESVLIAAAATLIGFAAARYGLVLLAGAAPDDLPRLDRASSDPTTAAIAVGIGAVALLVFGLLPALDGARADLQTVLRGSRHSAGRRLARLREAMIVGQVAVALMLVIGGGLMFRTVDRLLHVDPGFEPRGVLTARLSLAGERWNEADAVRAFQRELVDRIEALPGVEAAGLTSLLPLGGSYDRRGFGIEGQTYLTPDDAPRAERYSVTPGYFAAMGLRLRQGRLLDERDTTAFELVALVNDTAVRTYWGSANPIGQRIRFGDDSDSPWVTLAGVMHDVRHYDLETPPIPQLYLPQSQSTDWYPTLVVRAPAGIDGLSGLIRRELAALAPDVPLYDVVPLEELQTAAVGTRAFLMRLLGLFAAAAVLLAAVGLYGVISQAVTGREREIGIRMSLGARRAEVARLVLRRGLALVGAGLAVGLAGAAASSRLLEAQLFQTAALDPATYATAALSLLVAALAAHVLPLRRAVRVNPNLILRGD
jgi:putative ABC transport system permease protein